MVTSKNCIIRLSRYKNALYRLLSLGFLKVFSETLADEVGVTASQVRKDFSLFGISGNKKGGYQIEALLNKLSSILGKDKLQKVIVVGSGHIGTALMKYKGFEKEGIKITAGFDIDPAKCNKSGTVPVLPIGELKDFVKNDAIKIGIIATPDIAAQQVADLMFEAGIKGILNFAPIRIKSPQDSIVNYVNLELELENVIYFVNALNKPLSLSKDSA
ncbi:MAG: redox-sensing transcriptional repressor Rex [Candidatus Omnitrophica bacterium]|nr:redox-sensing transcriptional repressor Rex [Candidatus Omnitrophota bacterium]MDD5238044.1 redox-sensing transcriptional repressor Rex [Candidatus Omnitrophota bacterium]